MSAMGVILFVSFVILIAGGIYFRYILVGGLAVIFSLILAILIEPFRVQRILSFLDPFNNPTGDGHQIVQSFYALGSGSWVGLGVGMSRQKFGWLPEPYNDFIVPIIAEEIGFIGIIIL